MMHQHLCTTVVVVALCVCFMNTVDARRKGTENWKQRFQNWKESDEHHGTVISPDELADARRHREEFNSVWDSPTEKQTYQESLASEKKVRQNINEKQGISGVNDFDGQNVAARNSEGNEHRMNAENYHLRKRLPREYRLEQYVREQQQSNPPPHDKYAEMARYIVHNSDWGALAYTSRHPGSNGRAMADILSISDGSGGNSTGIPYMYVTPKDIGIMDLAKDSHCSLALTLAQGHYCIKESLDPEDPRCAHVYLNGKLKTLKIGSEEWTLARKYFFDRHPHLQNVPADHKFRFVKLKISQVIVQDYFGGPAYPTLAEYFAAKPDTKKSVKLPSQDAGAELLPGASSSDMLKVPIS